LLRPVWPKETSEPPGEVVRLLGTIALSQAPVQLEKMLRICVLTGYDSDAFTKREGAEEAMYVKRKEQEK